MEKILVSACLLGENTRYDGKNNKCDVITEINKYFDIVPFCPEVEGGLPTPRVPSEIIASGRVKNKEGEDVSKFFDDGANKALAICKYLGISLAILKENSPSCGSNQVYNGHFNNRLVKGEGITTKLLRSKGITVINEIEAIDFLAKYLKNNQTKEEAVKKDIEKQQQEKKQTSSLPKKDNYKNRHGRNDYKKAEKKPSFGNKEKYRKFDKKKKFASPNKKQSKEK